MFLNYLNNSYLILPRGNIKHQSTPKCIKIYDICCSISMFPATNFLLPASMQKYAKHVGLKRDFRLVVRGAARNMAAILNGSCTFRD